MRHHARWFILPGIVLGIAAGLLIGWVVWPVRYYNTAPTDLRSDYHDDYLVMVATAYEADGDLEAARARLAVLDPADPAAPLVELAQRLTDVGGSPSDAERLRRLASALDAAPETAP